MKQSHLSCVILLLLSLIIPASCLADNIVISGTAVADNENDQWVNMLFGTPLNQRFQNQGVPQVPTIRSCTVGTDCQVSQTIAGVFNVPQPSTGTYTYDFAFIELYFDMDTTAPVPSVTPGDPNANVFASGTFTGVLELFACGVGADCPFYGEVGLNSWCYTGSGKVSCPPTLLQTYALSGTAEGFTQTFNPRASVDFSFTGNAVLTPEPASLVLFGTGLLALAGGLRKKLIG